MRLLIVVVVLELEVLSNKKWAQLYGVINDYAIKLVNTDRFIKPSKSPAVASIFFDQKPDGFIWLYIDYKGPYNVPGHIGSDSQGSLKGYDKSYILRQAGKGLILLGNFFVGWHQLGPGDILSYP